MSPLRPSRVPHNDDNSGTFSHDDTLSTTPPDVPLDVPPEAAKDKPPPVVGSHQLLEHPRPGASLDIPEEEEEAREALIFHEKHAVMFLSQDLEARSKKDDGTQPGPIDHCVGLFYFLQYRDGYSTDDLTSILRQLIEIPNAQIQIRFPKSFAFVEDLQERHTFYEDKYNIVRRDKFGKRKKPTVGHQTTRRRINDLAFILSINNWEIGRVEQRLFALRKKYPRWCTVQSAMPKKKPAPPPLPLWATKHR